MFLLSAVMLLSSGGVTAGRFTRYVNPFIGTGAVENSLSGNCYPGATMPFGMVQLSPDTQAAPDWDKASGYDYNDSHLCGFSHTRLSGTGACDLIDLLLMPALSADDDQWSAVDHAKETARPGYYGIMLDTGIKAELTATTRAGIHRYTFPVGKPQFLHIDLDHSAPKTSWNRRIIQSQLRMVGPRTIEGYRIITGWAKLRRVYFHMELSRDISSFTIKDGDKDYGQVPVANGAALKAKVGFDSSEPEKLVVKVSLSTTSIENARLNMECEAPGWDFDDYASKADKCWDELLGRVEAVGKEHDLQKFYTALYHAFIQPNTMSDVSGDYTATDYSTRRMPDGETYYSTFSLWDTFRAAHPLYTIIAPERNAAFVNSMLAHYDAYGYLPIWSLWGQDNYCMIGNHAIPVVVDAVLKNLPGIDPERALNSCVASATINHPGSQFSVWERYGYMPEDIQSQSVSITLEQAFDDWCVAQLARSLGHEEICQRFTKRSQYYRNLYNKHNGFFQARTSDGRWMEPFDPLQYGANGGNPYTEGNAWQYLWYVPHDIDGLVSLMGGRSKFVERLDTFFILNARSGRKNDNASGFIGQYVHGNEPSHHVAYLYNYVGKPHCAQRMIARICKEMYNTSSSGYAGNDDCGEMSSWFVFSAMGFYPVNPVGGDYSLGSPVLDSVTLNLSNGRKFVIKAYRKSSSGPEVKAMRLNGTPYRKHTLAHSDIMNGGTLEFFFMIGDMLE